MCDAGSENAEGGQLFLPLNRGMAFDKFQLQGRDHFPVDQGDGPGTENHKQSQSAESRCRISCSQTSYLARRLPSGLKPNLQA